VPTQTQLDKIKPYGEVFMDMGLIVLFVDIIKEDYPNLENDVLSCYVFAPICVKIPLFVTPL